MKESEFIKKNKAEWQRLGEVLKHKSTNPDELHELFLKVSSDLSYAQTYFPRRGVRWYLNHMVSHVFDEIRKSSKVDYFASIKRFYNVSLPREILRNRKTFYISFLTFAVALFIGFYSSMLDVKYPSYILGDEYIQMTENNIQKGLPFDVYSTIDEVGFVRITVNNILVAARSYALGLIAGLGSIIILLFNGIMLGAFEALFYNKGLFVESLMTIWIHGTIEIISIVIASAAGLIVGRHMLFPGSFTRLESLRIGAFRSITIILSTIPLIFVAGFLESFVTPAETSSLVKISVIAGSLFLMGYIYIYKPYIYLRKVQRMPSFSELDDEVIEAPKVYQVESDESTFVKKSFQFVGNHLSSLIKLFFLPLILGVPIMLYLYFNLAENDFIYAAEKNTLNHFSRGGLFGLIIPLVLFVQMCAVLHFLLIKSNEIPGLTLRKMFRENWNVYLLFALIYVLIPYAIDNSWFIFLLIVLVPPSLISHTFLHLRPGVPAGQVLGKAVSEAYSNYSSYFLTIVAFLLLLLSALGAIKLFSALSGYVNEFINIFESVTLNTAFIENTTYYFTFFVFYPMAILIFYFKNEQMVKERTSIDIRQKLAGWM